MPGWRGLFYIGQCRTPAGALLELIQHAAVRRMVRFFTFTHSQMRGPVMYNSSSQAGKIGRSRRLGDRCEVSDDFYPNLCDSWDCRRTNTRVSYAQSGGLVVVFPGQGGLGTGPAVFASVDLVCGGTTYTVSTGNSNKGAECQAGGNGNNALCDDGQGNKAEVNCSSGCKSAAGSGSCKVKQ